MVNSPTPEAPWETAFQSDDFSHLESTANLYQHTLHAALLDKKLALKDYGHLMQSLQKSANNPIPDFLPLLPASSSPASSCFPDLDKLVWPLFHFYPADQDANLETLYGPLSSLRWPLPIKELQPYYQESCIQQNISPNNSIKEEIISDLFNRALQETFDEIYAETFHHLFRSKQELSCPDDSEYLLSAIKVDEEIDFELASSYQRSCIIQHVEHLWDRFWAFLAAFAAKTAQDNPLSWRDILTLSRKSGLFPERYPVSYFFNTLILVVVSTVSNHAYFIFTNLEKDFNKRIF
jgi:hypothetical protein